DGEYTAVSSLTEGEHSLLHIVADSIIVMMERNHALLQEARDMNQLGMAAEVLIIAANNFAWIRQRCQRIPMANAREVEEILTQSLAGVLQDIIDGFVEEIQYILSMYMTSSGGGGGGRQRVVTHSFLATRVTAICRLSNGLVHLLPRWEVMSIVLEQSLRPVVEQLLVGDKQNDVERGG
ncbi:putative ankyrin repeat protein, partial [Trypanosoma cruzi]